MGYGPAIEAFFKIAVPIIMVVAILIRVSKAGADKAKVKVLEQEKKDQEAFNEAGEEWDSHGGLGGIVTRRVSRKSWSLRKSLGLDK